MLQLQSTRCRSAVTYWLVKSDPEEWSWADQIKAAVTPWDGVRNRQATNHLRAMKEGDLVFFYHSGREKQIVGTVRVVKEHYPDPSDETGQFVVVDLQTVRALKTPVTLQQIKAHRRLSGLALVRQARLSVTPIDANAWKTLCELGGVNP